MVGTSLHIRGKKFLLSGTSCSRTTAHQTIAMLSMDQRTIELPRTGETDLQQTLKSLTTPTPPRALRPASHAIDVVWLIRPQAGRVVTHCWCSASRPAFSTPLDLSLSHHDASSCLLGVRTRRHTQLSSYYGSTFVCHTV